MKASIRGVQDSEEFAARARNRYYNDLVYERMNSAANDRKALKELYGFKLSSDQFARFAQRHHPRKGAYITLPYF